MEIKKYDCVAVLAVFNILALKYLVSFKEKSIQKLNIVETTNSCQFPSLNLTIESTSKTSLKYLINSDDMTS